MFKLKESESFKITSVKGANEKHGKELVKCLDVNFKGIVSNTVLNDFDKTLLGKFFKFKPKDDADLVDSVSEIPTKPDMPLSNKEYNLSWEGEGYRVEIPYGTSGKNDLCLIDCTVNNFKFTPLDGGMIELSFHVRSKLSIKDAHEISLAMMLWSDNPVCLTLEPPSAEKQAEMALKEEREELRSNPAA